jgi:hypothetical protein
MKKKYRYRKRSVPGLSAPGADDATRDEEIGEEDREESPAAESPEKAETAQAPQPGVPGKLEVVFGMGLLGLLTGFLSGYGNMEIMPAVFYSVVGLGIGLFLGNIPYLSLK